MKENIMYLWQNKKLNSQRFKYKRKYPISLPEIRHKTEANENLSVDCSLKNIFVAIVF